jgi:colanic acid biosynthesis glycosyl transferase WcaI
VPSKTYGIMAAGRPILYIGPAGATPAHILEGHGCGWRVEPGDTAGLVRLLERLEQDRSLVREAGGRARRAFEQFYDKPIGVERILSILGVSETPRPDPAFAAITPSTV